METCSLYYGAKECGKVSWNATDTGILVEARCPCELGMIYRILLQTEVSLIPLGVMLPEGQEFVLKKQIFGQEMPLCAFIDRTLPGEQHLPGLPVALSAFSDVGAGLLLAQWMDVQYLLFSLEPGKQCSAAQFLSIATPLLWENRWYGLFCKRNGQYQPYSDRLCKGAVVR